MLDADLQPPNLPALDGPLLLQAAPATEDEDTAQLWRLHHRDFNNLHIPSGHVLSPVAVPAPRPALEAPVAAAPPPNPRGIPRVSIFFEETSSLSTGTS